MNAIQKWFRTRNQRKLAKRRARPRPLAIEPLEIRAVFDIGVGGGGVLLPGISLGSDGVLHIKGDKRDDAAIVSVESGQVVVRLDQTEFKKIGIGGSPVPFTTHSEKQFAVAQIKSIWFNGASLTYFRWGALGQKAKSDADPAPLAWNSGGGTLNFPDMAFTGKPNWYTQIVQHETGHNWGHAGLANWNDFLAMSDWQLWNNTDPFDQTKFEKTEAYDEVWLYSKTALFANDYGTTHPLEDFATAFESYFAHIEGRTFLTSDDSAAEIVDKWAFIDAFVDTLM